MSVTDHKLCKVKQLCLMPEVDVPALLDIGSKVSTITKDFSNRHFRSKGHKNFY